MTRRWANPSRRALFATPLVVGLALALSVAACGGNPRYEGVGVVEGVDREARQVVIAHGDIADLMPAMTMNFDVAHPALLDPLEPGQSVRFVLARERHAYRIVEIRAEGSALAPVKGGRTPALAAGRAPDLDLVDHNGRAFSLESLRGKTIVLDFIYTQCPGPCPALTGLHVDVQRALPPALREETHFVSVSIDPLRDTPEALRAYARARGIDLASWTLLTGAVADVETVLRSYAVGSLPQNDGSVDHQIVTYLIDGEGAIVSHYWGSGQSVAEWVTAIAAAGRGDAAEAVL